MGSARALAEYEGTDYKNTNSYLREGPRVGRPGERGDEIDARLDAKAAASVAEIDKTMQASRLTEDVEVERVVQADKNAFGADAGNPDFTGAKWKEKAYVSTTADPRITGEYGDRYKRASGGRAGSEPVVLKIHVPAGTGAVQLSPIATSSSRGEGELLLERGLTMQVIADRGVNDAGLRVLEAAVVPE